MPYGDFVVNAIDNNFSDLKDNKIQRENNNNSNNNKRLIPNEKFLQYI